MEKIETKRILKTIGYYYSDGEEHKRCPVCGIDPTKLEQEIEKAREEEIQKILDKMPQYVERNGREYYLDFYIKDISGERYYCSCYTNGDKKLTPEYDEEILLRSLVKTRDYLSKLKE